MIIRFNAFIVSALLVFIVGGCTATSTTSTTLDTSIIEKTDQPNVLTALLAPEKPPAVRPAKPKATGLAAKPYHAIIAKYAKLNNVPVDLAHAVVFSESTYRANATGSVGEIGLMQLRLATARGVGYTGSRKGLYDPETNIKYGMKYLGKARELAGGSTCGTILRYNAGHYAKRMNPISQRYCNKVRKLLAA